jgi:hypothetical protein
MAKDIISGGNGNASLMPFITPTGNTFVQFFGLN